MKKRTKRALSFLLTLAMAFGMVASFPMTSSAASGNWTDNAAVGFSSINTTDKKLTITSEEEFALFVKNLQGDSTTYAAWTVLLDSDLNLSAHYWTPCNLVDVTFDGQGNTITGLEINNSCRYVDGDTNMSCHATGLFGALDRSTVQNLTLDSPNIQYGKEWTLSAGTVAGYVKGSRIRDVVVENPTIFISRVEKTAFIGGIAGYTTDTSTPITGKNPISVITGCDVSGGSIHVDEYWQSADYSPGENGSAVYLGGIVGANYASMVGSCTVNGTKISSSDNVFCSGADEAIFGFWTGGIAGYTSMTDLPLLGSCLFNNMSSIKFDISATLDAINYHVGGICGQVKNDDVVNNLYFGTEDILGSISNTSGYVTSHNYKYDDAANTWAAEGGNGALYGVLNGSGLNAAATALNGHRNDSIAEALKRLKIWKTDSTTHYPYLVWEHTVIFNPNGGSVTTTSAIVGTNGKVAEFPTPTRNNHSFNGWFTQASGGTQVTTDHAFTSSAVIYAQWTNLGGGGGGMSIGTSYYTVKFSTNGGSEVNSQSVKIGDKLARPTTPTKDGFIFDGWYSDASLTTSYDFDKAVTSGFTLYAKWTESSSNIPSHPFTDVRVTDWFNRDLAYIYNMRLIDGKTPTSFVPDDEFTYAEAIKLAACMNELYTTGKITLKNGQPWYQSYVDYAKANDIINRDFEWNKPITRANYMAIFAKALPQNAFKRINNVADGGVPDVPMTHVHADAIYTLYRAGIVQGVDSDHKIRPDSNIKRCEVVSVVNRMMDEGARIEFELK